jgi:methionyl-tRNA synthetase
MKKLKAFIGCFIWGFCPKCNSDAPAIDTCKVCKNYRSFEENQTPKEILKAEWWLRYVRQEYFSQATKQYLDSL